MPVADVALVLAQARRFADTNGLTLAARPMHEVAAHPHAAAAESAHGSVSAVSEPVA